MNIAEQLQAVADNLATEHQEIAAQAELLQQVKANLGGKAAPGASTSLYRHQVRFGDPDDMVIYTNEGHECSPHIFVEVYNRNPNEMTYLDLVNGGHIPYSQCTPFWIANWDDVDDIYFVADLFGDASGLHMSLWNPNASVTNFWASFNPKDLYVYDTVTKV